MSAELLEKAASSSSVSEKEEIYRSVLKDDSAKALEKETAILKLGELFREASNAKGLAEVITLSRTFMTSQAKAKTAKLIRTLLNHLDAIQTPDSAQIQTQVLQDNIAWAKDEKRIFLKHSLELRLASLYLTQQQFKASLALLNTLLVELRRLDDKMVLTEVHLLESRVYLGVRNVAKSKAALTSARTFAASIYCPPSLQASLDLQSGILHAEDKDWTTASSYFYEAFENLSALGEADDTQEGGVGAGVKGGRALMGLKYLLLCKVMLNLPEEVNTLLTSKAKLAGKYAQTREVDSMRAIAKAHENRNLGDFQKALRDYKDALSADPIVRSHLTALYDTLLQQNLLRIVEPYSVVEIDYVASQLGEGSAGLGRSEVEQKLSQMILDKTLSGVLDQGRGCLVLYEEAEADPMYGAAISTLGEIGKVVESLYAKTVKIA
ncbi:PCI domain-containing protein [Flagelloscypha sp. PMI_526]|nr:PCI domain-containing protein [Flagelloscypha sp. PMI_526]